MVEAIHTTNLSRQFAGDFGVHNLNLNVPAGCIFGFLRPEWIGQNHYNTTNIEFITRRYW